MDKTRLDVALELVTDMDRVAILSTSLEAKKELTVSQKVHVEAPDLTFKQGRQSGLLVLGILGKVPAPDSYLENLAGKGYKKIVVSGDKEGIALYEKVVKKAGYNMGRKRILKGTRTILREFKLKEKHNSYQG